MKERMLTIYGRANCHLCDEMKHVVGPIAAQHGYLFEEIDITGDAELESQFGDQVPVLLVNGRKAFKYRVTAGRLRRRLLLGF